MQRWQQLLLDKKYLPEEALPFGPNGHQVCAALDAINNIRWFINVGSQSALVDAVQLPSWSAVLELIEESWTAGYGGNLKAPSDLCSIDGESNLYPLFVRLYEESCKVLHFSPNLPNQLEEPERAKLNSYLRSWCELLFCEIVRADEVRCTYFREQLQWFATGRFPAGWVGEWPVGKMLVF